MSDMQSSLSKLAIGFPPSLVRVKKKLPEGSAVHVRSWALQRPNPDEIAASAPVDEESALVHRALAGNSEALERLLAPHIARLHRIAFRVLGNKEDAEDAVQDGLLSAHRKLKSFQGRSRFSTWLTRIVINAALMLRRRKSVRPESSLDEMEGGITADPRNRIVDPQCNPEQLCASAESGALIEESVRRLPRKLQAAFRLCKMEGLSEVESAAILGVGRGTCKARLFRARKQLARSLPRALWISCLPASDSPR